MAARNEEFAIRYQRLKKAIKSRLFDSILFSFALCFKVLYFFSSSAIVGASFSRLFFNPSGKVNENTAPISSTWVISGRFTTCSARSGSLQPAAIHAAPNSGNCNMIDFELSVFFRSSFALCKKIVARILPWRSTRRMKSAVVRP